MLQSNQRKGFKCAHVVCEVHWSCLYKPVGRPGHAKYKYIHSYAVHRPRLSHNYSTYVCGGQFGTKHQPFALRISSMLSPSRTRDRISRTHGRVARYPRATFNTGARDSANLYVDCCSRAWASITYAACSTDNHGSTAGVAHEQEIDEPTQPPPRVSGLALFSYHPKAGSRHVCNAARVPFLANSQYGGWLQYRRRQEDTHAPFGTNDVPTTGDRHKAYVSWTNRGSFST